MTCSTFALNVTFSPTSRGDLLEAGTHRAQSEDWNWNASRAILTENSRGLFGHDSDRLTKDGGFVSSEAWPG